MFKNKFWEKAVALIKLSIKKVLLLPSLLYFKIANSNVECNICKFKANRFRSNDWHSYIICPNCGSEVRHRLLWATFEHINDFSLTKLIKNKSVLHFAPEKIIRLLLKKFAKNYKTADYFSEGYTYDNIDYYIDISNMYDIKDEFFDCVIACDVLEHVEDDTKAIKEVYRILKNGGYSIFTVPQRDNLKITYEDPLITNPDEREKAYGQFDHLRIYGDDFISLLESYSFKVFEIDENCFTKQIAERNVLFPPIKSEIKNVTNYRKVFIGLK